MAIAEQAIKPAASLLPFASDELGRQTDRAARNLADRAPRCAPRGEYDGQSREAFVPDGCTLDGATRLELDHHRDDTALWKIHSLDLAILLVQRFLESQGVLGEMGTEAFEVLFGHQ